MVTNNYDFKTVTRLRMLCMKVLPTVYGDALSYEEQVCKVTEKINQLVDTVNALPDYIVEVVKELIDAAGLEDIVKNVLADLYFINVKNPPAPFIAAKGDGATNDTAAIQALINYAGLQRSYLFFPAGNYIVTGLTMVENVSLVGLDRYSSIITLAPDSNRDLVTGFVENASISNLTLNANMNGQTANCSCLNATVDNALIDFVIFRNGYDSVVVENTNEFEGAYWLFDGIQHNALTLNGDGAVISNVIFKNASQLSANALAVVNGNNKITGIFSNVAIPTGVVISATGATVEGTILNARTTITGGIGNYVDIEDLTGLNKYGTNDTETFTGNKTITAVNSTEHISGTKSVNAANETITITGTKTENTGDTNETITGTKTENIGTKNVKAATVTENITDSETKTVNVSTENVATEKRFNAENISLNSTQPLGYKPPVDLNDNFRAVPMKSLADGTEYNVLVEKPGADIESNVGTWEVYTEGTGIVNANVATFPTFVASVALNRKLGLMNVSFIANTGEVTGKPLDGNVPIFTFPFKIPANVTYGEYETTMLTMYRADKTLSYSAHTGSFIVSDANGVPTWQAIMENYGTSGYNCVAVMANCTIYVGDWDIIDSPTVTSGWVKYDQTTGVVNANPSVFPTFVSDIWINQKLGLMEVSFIANTNLATGTPLNGTTPVFKLPFKMAPSASYGIYEANILDMYNSQAGKEFNYFAHTGAILSSDANGVPTWNAIMENYGTDGFNCCAIVGNVMLPIKDYNFTEVG